MGSGVEGFGRQLGLALTAGDATCSGVSHADENLLKIKGPCRGYPASDLLCFKKGGGGRMADELNATVHKQALASPRLHCLET